MRKRKIKMFNGRWFYGNKHIYIGAYSIKDACEICSTLSGNSRGWLYEINEYFSKGCWGNAMNGIPLERGAWLADDKYHNPVVKRVIDADGKKIIEETK